MSKRVNSLSPCHYEGKKVLLVEGNTDCHVVMALCKEHQVENNLFGLYDCGSDTQALRRLNALIDAPVLLVTGHLLLVCCWMPTSKALQVAGKALNRNYGTSPICYLMSRFQTAPS